MIALISWYFQATQYPDADGQDSGHLVSFLFVPLIWLGHSLSWLQPDHAAQIYNSVIVLFGWNNSCSCRWTTMNWNQLCASVLTGQLPNTIMKIHVLNQTVGPKYLKMEQFISLWEICENWTISSFWPFWRLSASTLVSEKEQGVATTNWLLLSFCKSIFAQNYLKLD